MNSSKLIIAVFCIVFSFGCSQKYQKGKVIYTAQCAGCHGNQGEGFQKLYPPINKTSLINQHIDLLPCIIQDGITEESPLHSGDYNLPMYGTKGLDATDISNLINYIHSAFLDRSQYQSLQIVEQQMADCP